MGGRCVAFQGVLDQVLNRPIRWIAVFFVQPIFFSSLLAPKLIAAELLGTQTIKIGSAVLTVELAVSETEQMKGLMNRSSLGPNEGMLFVFEKPKKASFWMKNTFIPLSIGFFDKNRRLLNILDMEPMKSESQIPQVTYESKGIAAFALEVNQGWFRTHKIEVISGKPRPRFDFVNPKEAQSFIQKAQGPRR